MFFSSFDGFQIVCIFSFIEIYENSRHKVINVSAKPKRSGIKVSEFSVRAVLEFISNKLYSVLCMPLGQAEKKGIC